MTSKDQAAVLVERGGELLQGREGEEEGREGGRKKKEEKPTHLTQAVGQRKGKRRSGSVLNERKIKAGGAERRTTKELLHNWREGKLRRDQKVRKKLHIFERLHTKKPKKHLQEAYLVYLLCGFVTIYSPLCNVRWVMCDRWNGSEGGGRACFRTGWKGLAGWELQMEPFISFKFSLSC